MKEIDELCQEEQIPYFLSPRLALNAYYQAGLPENPQFGTLFMKAADMERFRSSMSAKLKADRALESMKNSPYFPGFYLRYVHTGTLLYHLNKGRNYLFPGIAIEICPLQSPRCSRRNMKWNRILMTGWKQTCDLYNETFSFRDKLCVIPVKAASVLGRRRLGSYIYDRLVKASKDGRKASRYFVDRDVRTWYPARIFDEMMDIPLEGLVLKCPSDIRRYLKTYYGDDFRKRLATSYEPSWACMVSTRVPCADFIEEAGDLEELIWRRRDGYMKDEEGRKARVYASQTWDYLKLLEKGINLGMSYSDIRVYLIRLHQEKDYMRLDTAFSKYHDMTKEYLANDLLYCPDEELFTIYLEMLRNTGRSGFANKLAERKENSDGLLR